MGIGSEIYFEKVVADMGWWGHMMKVWGSSSTGVQGHLLDYDLVKVFIAGKTHD